MDEASLVLVGLVFALALSGTYALTGERWAPRRALLHPGVARVIGAAGSLGIVRRAREAEARARSRAECLSELPVKLDVVTLGLSAGLSFDSSLELYCSRYGSELSGLFSEAMLSWRIGARGREEALVWVAGEVGVSALGRFAAVVSEALAFGTPLAETLEQQAQAIREEQRSQVEEEIEKVPVKMLIPLGTLIVPAMFLAILGPLLGSALVVG